MEISSSDNLFEFNRLSLSEMRWKIYRYKELCTHNGVGSVRIGVVFGFNAFIYVYRIL